MAVQPVDTAMSRLPPHDQEAEQSVLGAMLVNPNAILAVLEMLVAEDFYRDSHRLIFRAVVELNKRGQEVDVVTLGAQLEREGILERVGGREFIHTLAEFVPAAANAVYYAEIVREQSVLRALIRAGNEIAELGYRRAGTTAELLDSAEKTVFAIHNERRVAEFQHLKQILVESFLRIQEGQESDGVTGLATGFDGLDDFTGGFQKTNLIVLAARPGVGKTSLALNIAHNVSVDHGHPVAVFSLEMSALELCERLMCSQARVSSHKLRTARLTGEEMSKLVTAAGVLEKADVFIDDSSDLNMFELRAKARRLFAKTPPALIIVDYLQLMAGDSRAESRQQEVANISRSLKQLARELEVPIIAVSQLNRAPESSASGEPHLSHLRESGAIEQDADLVLFLYEDQSDPASKGIIKLKVAKNRHGRVGTVRLAFNREYTRFLPLSLSEDYDIGDD